MTIGLRDGENAVPGRSVAKQGSPRHTPGRRQVSAKWSGAVKRALRMAGLLALSLAAAGCSDRPEADQIAQHSMIGLSKKTILACLGKPAWRDVVGSTQVWTYPIGALRSGGASWAVGLDLGATPIGPGGSCDVKLVFTNARVSQVTYAALGGGDAPLGQRCVFPVYDCVPSP